MLSGFGADFFGGAAFHPLNSRFEDFFRCYPVAMMSDKIRKDDANYGGKVFLPPSALSKLTMLHIRYPMLFQLTNKEAGITTHSGVLEFVAEEGRVYLPQWIMQTLQLQPGSLVQVASCDLPNGLFVKLEPQLVDFLDISDPKAVLENALRKFSTLTVDDFIEIDYNDTTYGIRILEVKPESANKGICVVETDLETEFAPPVGYVEPERVSAPSSGGPKIQASAGAGTMAHSIGYATLVAEGNIATLFRGEGQKLSGKEVKTETKKITIDDLDENAAPVPLELPENQLFLGWPVKLAASSYADESTEKSIYTGEGNTLRQSKKRPTASSNTSGLLKNYSRSPDHIDIDD